MGWALYLSLVGCLLLGQQPVVSEARDDLQLMQGRWVLLEWVAIPRKPYVPVEPSLLVVNGNVIRWIVPGGAGGRDIEEVARFRINPAATPKQIDLLFGKESPPRLGIYEVTDRILVLYLSRAGSKHRPNDFSLDVPEHLIGRLDECRDSLILERVK